MTPKVRMCRCGDSVRQHDGWSDVWNGGPRECNVPGCSCKWFDWDRR